MTTVALVSAVLAAGRQPVFQQRVQVCVRFAPEGRAGGPASHRPRRGVHRRQPPHARRHGRDGPRGVAGPLAQWPSPASFSLPPCGSSCVGVNAHVWRPRWRTQGHCTVHTTTPMANHGETHWRSGSPRTRGGFSISSAVVNTTRTECMVASLRFFTSHCARAVQHT